MPKMRLVHAAILAFILLAASVQPAFGLTRDEVIGRAQRWVDLGVSYSQVHEFESYRQDCSGMVSMAWRLDRSYSSRTLEPHGIRISRDELQPGDMLLKYDYHANIFYKWANAEHTWYWALEQSGSVGHAVNRLTRYPYWDKEDVYAYRSRVITEVNDYGPYITPVAGSDRYATAVAASRLAFTDGTATRTVICSGETWPDALGGSALAGALDGPILLVRRTSLPGTVAEELARLGTTEVTIIGGVGAVDPVVAEALAALPGISVRRIGGADRYETAAMVASETVAAQVGSATPFDRTVYIATGATFADALGAAPVAAYTGRPILLSRPNTLPSVTAETIRSLEASTALVAGGEGALDSTVTAALEDAGATSIERFAGANRYETSLLLAKHGADEGLAWDDIAIATGTGFADALAGGVMQAKRGSMVVLTPPNRLAPAPDWAVREHVADIEKVTVLGGEGAVEPIVRRQLRWILDEP